MVFAILGAAALAVAGDTMLIRYVGAVLLGIAAVWVVSLFFYEVGLGEDIDRARGGRGPYDR